VLAAEHRVASDGDAALVGERDEQTHRLLRDPVLREVGVNTRRLQRETIDPRGVLGEQLAQVEVLRGLVVPARRGCP
jgi:hypothetical protein